MKKILIIPMLILLTGCFGEAGKGYINKTCEKTENINGRSLNTNITIKSKSGSIETITITETYDKKIDLTSITTAKKSEQNLYKTLNGITLEINDNIFTYTIDKQNADQIIIEKFNIKDEQHKQIKYYEENGYTCK